MNGSFTITGTDRNITAKVAAITLQAPGFTGPISIWGGPSFAPTATLLKNRRYHLYSSNSYMLDDFDSRLSVEPDLNVSADGTATGIGNVLARSFTISGTTMSAKLSRMSVNPNGYVGNVYIPGHAGNGGGGILTAKVLMGRRYEVIPHDNDQPLISVASDGTTCTPSTNRYTQGTVYTMQVGCQPAGVATVTVKSGGDTGTVFTGSICVSGQGCTESGQPRDFDLPAGTYTVSSPYSSELASDTDSLGTLSVASDGTVSLDSTAQQHFHPPDPVCAPGKQPPCSTVRAKVADVTYVTNGYTGSLSIYGGPTIVADAATKLLVARRYTLYATYSYQNVDLEDSRFSSVPDLMIDPDGGVSPTPAAAGNPAVTVPLTMAGSTITANVSEITYNPMGYTGPSLAIWGGPSFVPDPEGGLPKIKLLKNRRYYLYSSYSYIPGAFDSRFSPKPDIAISAAPEGNVSASDPGVDGSFTITGTDRNITAKVQPITLQAPGFAGPIAIWGGPSFAPTATLLRNRRYYLYSSNSYMTSDFDSRFSVDPDLNVSAGGTATLVGATVTPSFDISASTLTAKLSQMTVDPSGFLGTVSIPGHAGNGGSGALLNANVLRGRRYEVIPHDAGQALVAVSSDGASCTPSIVQNGGFSMSVVCSGGQSNPVTNCSGWAAGTPCDDGNACTQSTVCNGSGACGSGSAVVCDDGRACTADSCEPVAGCVHATAPMEGQSCGPGNTCETNTCQAGACILQARPSSPSSCNNPPVTANVRVPPGVSGTLAFKYESSNAPASVINAFGLIKRSPAGDPTYIELLDTSKRTVGETFFKTKVEGGEVFEFYLQANKTGVAQPSVTRATYSSDFTRNTAVDPTAPEHVALPTQTPAPRRPR